MREGRRRRGEGREGDGSMERERRGRRGEETLRRGRGEGSREM